MVTTLFADSCSLSERDQELLTEFNCRSRIVRHMALAFFASAWADWTDNHGGGVGSGVEVMDAMPDEMDSAALDAAHKLADGMEASEGKSLEETFWAAVGLADTDDLGGGDRPCDEEHFGHYAAMQAMGHGVGLESVGIDPNHFHVPDIEFSQYDLDPVKYPIPDDDADDDDHTCGDFDPGTQGPVGPDRCEACQAKA